MKGYLGPKPPLLIQSRGKNETIKYLFESSINLSGERGTLKIRGPGLKPKELYGRSSRDDGGIIFGRKTVW